MLRRISGSLFRSCSSSSSLSASSSSSAASAPCKLRDSSPWPRYSLSSGRRHYGKSSKAKSPPPSSRGKEEDFSPPEVEEVVVVPEVAVRRDPPSIPPNERILACVALERLPLVVPPPAPEVLAFKNFSSEWHDQYRRHYSKEFIDILSSSNEREENAFELKFEPGPRITEADKANDRKSLQRALDRRLFLIVQGFPLGRPKDKPVWHFPERLYKNEETLRLCAESVLMPIAAKEEDLYYVGNAPCGHFCEDQPDPKSKMPITYKRFFFRSQLLGKVRYKALNCKDYAWVTKEELLEYFELDQSIYMKQMLVDDLRVIF